MSCGAFQIAMSAAKERAAHEIPGVVEVDDRLPVWDLPDGDACGLQIFELLGRGVACC